MERILFIINPISGTRNKLSLPGLIAQHIDSKRYSWEITNTKCKGDGTHLAKEAAEAGYDVVVAVGGDGTVNEVASGVRDSQTAFGILPIGSGNGLARTVGIPMNTVKAIELLNTASPTSIDYGLINGHPFFCTCGTGFDAVISHRFAQQKKRGLLTYIKTMFPTYANYHPEHIVINAKGIHVDTNAFFVTVANAGQWGNNAYVAPQADLQDGVLDICIMSKMPIYEIPIAVFNMFTRRMDKDLFMTTLKASSLSITRENAGPFHFDGEPNSEPAKVDISVVNRGLKIIAGSNSKLKW